MYDPTLPPPSSRRGAQPAVLAAIGDDESDRIVAAIAVQTANLWPGGELHFVHVVDALPVVQTAVDRAVEWPRPGVDDLRRKGLDYLDRFTWEAGNALGRSVRGHLLFGPPAVEIMKLAKRLRASLLVVGTREVGSVVRLLMGSTAHALLHRAPCPVLLAREPSYAAEEPDEDDLCADCLWADASSCGVTPRCPRHAFARGGTCDGVPAAGCGKP